MNRFWITGLVSANFTPMHEDGSLNLAQVGPIVENTWLRKTSAHFSFAAAPARALP